MINTTRYVDSTSDPVIHLVLVYIGLQMNPYTVNIWGLSKLIEVNQS